MIEGGCRGGVIFLGERGGGCARGGVRERVDGGRCKRGWLHEGGDDGQGNGDDYQTAMVGRICGGVL